MTCDEKGGGKMLDGLSIKWEDTSRPKAPGHLPPTWEYINRPSFHEKFCSIFGLEILAYRLVVNVKALRGLLGKVPKTC